MVRHGTVDSTSEEAFRAIAAGEARDGDVHVAAGQTGGRGRLGRSWESAEGEGLYLSVVLRPAALLPHPALLTLAAGLAVRDFALESGCPDAALKWPNDVLVRDAKLAGILVESRGLDPAAPHYVIGVGLNVAQREFSEELLEERAVTSLALEGITTTPAEAEPGLLRHLAARLAAAELRLADIESDYLEATALRGSLVRLRRGDETAEGFLEGFSLAEGILLRRRDGWLAKFPVEHVAALEAVP